MTPWEQLGDAEAEQLGRLVAREDPASGKALDIGCGSGKHSLELAARGWQVTGIDVVPQAIRRAKRRASTAGAKVRFLRGDATRMSSQVGTGYLLLLDLGCFHSLDDKARTDYAREATAVAAPGAALLMFAFAGGTPRPLPRGVDRAEVAATFDGWQLTDTEPAVLPPRLADRTTANWFRLHKLISRRT